MKTHAGRRAAIAVAAVLALAGCGKDVQASLTITPGPGREVDGVAQISEAFPGSGPAPDRNIIKILFERKPLYRGSPWRVEDIHVNQPRLSQENNPFTFEAHTPIEGRPAGTWRVKVIIERHSPDGGWKVLRATSNKVTWRRP